MLTPTYVPLASTTLSADSLAVTFSSISQSYRDLVLVCTGGVVARTSTVINFNNDSTSANYAGVYAIGSGTSTGGSGTLSNNFSEVWENSSTNLTTSIIQIMDYSATDKHKTCLIRSGNATPNGVEMWALRYASTSAITTIQIYSSGSFLSGSTFVLYGIAG